VYPATIVGITPMEDFYIGGASVKLFLPIFKMNFPEIVDIALPAEGVFHNLVFVSIKKTYPMQAYKIMHGLWGMGQMMFTKYIVVVDAGVNVHNTSEVLFHLTANTDPQRDSMVAALVWRAITTPEDMSRWYFDMKHFKPQAGCEFSFVVQHEGNNYDHRCKITEVITQKKIAYTWRYHGHKGNSLVTFELFADGFKTKLKLTHEGLETFPKAPQFARNNFVRGWTSLIGSELKDFVENADREIFILREFNAPRELVWEAMTNPKHVVNWWGPRGFTTTIEKMDFRAGGVWQHVMRGPDGANYPNKSVFKEIVSPERIVFQHGGRREGGPGVNFVSTWSFEKLAADKTRVSIRMIFPSAAERDFVVKEFGAIEGGKQTLEKLGEHLAKM
jgi:uncharacterized protein YndB with AHSA1/START domain